MSNPVIKTSGLTKFYGKTKGIENLDLQIERGVMFGFLGPNGAGKSTTIRLLLNFLKPTSGSAEIFGKNVHRSYYSIFKKIGNVPGELKMYEELTGNYFLNYMNSFLKREPVWQKELIAAFSLSDEDLKKKIKQYSRGMKQKLAIIQAMQEKPDLLIMDEPSAGLDPLNKDVLYHYLLKYKQEGKTVFFSSHNLAEVEKICDHVGLVRNGTLIALEAISSLKKKMVRKMEITFLENFSLQDFKLDSTSIIEHKNNRLVLTVVGDINPLIKKLSAYKIENMVFPEPSLEDTFLSYYKN